MSNKPVLKLLRRVAREERMSYRRLKRQYARASVAKKTEIGRMACGEQA